jgi:transposase
LIWRALAGPLRSRAPLQAEILVIRQQLNALDRRSPKPVAVSNVDRLVFVGLYCLDDRFPESCHKGGIHLCLEAPLYGSVALGRGVARTWQRRAIELSLGDVDSAKLRSIAHSRTQPASRVERARIFLTYREDPSVFAVGRRLGLHHQTVQRCVERAVAEGPMAVLDDRPRPGKEPTITPEAKTWLVSLACRKAKELGYPHELWTTRLLASHAREHGPAQGHACLARLAQGTVCKILDQEDVKPHKVRLRNGPVVVKPWTCRRLPFTPSPVAWASEVRASSTSRRRVVASVRGQRGGCLHDAVR